MKVPRQYRVSIHPRSAVACCLSSVLALSWCGSLLSAQLAEPAGTIAFSSVAPRGWNIYMFDIASGEEVQLTQHPSLDYNATWSPDGRHILFVSERDGNMELYSLDLATQQETRLTEHFGGDDHPVWSPDGRHIAFSSTREPAEVPGQAWNAVYVLDIETKNIGKLTPPGVADYSPTWSACGSWIAVASGSGRVGGSAIYVMKPDGSERRRVAADGGWPAFLGENLVFHSRRGGRWEIWQTDVDGSEARRISPTGIDVYTPRSNASAQQLVVTTQSNNHRQIAMLDPATGETRLLTRRATDHWNPSISPDGLRVVYHRQTEGIQLAEVETWSSPPESKLRLLRMVGSFPAFSPDASQVALVGRNFSSLDIMNSNGSNRRTIYRGSGRSVFSVSWAKSGEDTVAFATGPTFQSPAARVDISVIKTSGDEHQLLTSEHGNNAFPSFSPDGQKLVFRSGRDGNKNLYIMQRDGTNIQRLTQGGWTDTMCHWSPKGDWIVFSSDRDGNYDIWLIRPDGSELTKLVGGGGRNNHPHFSPDGEWIVFTSQRAGYSAEAISLPHQPQPYGSLFMIRQDGSDLTRLTHNGFEEGTPEWGVAIETNSNRD
ncbi:MAG TPA: DPP IV N-terminal domain-containing protein [Pirellulaceae bacterium]|nr:DPP IV N-terminal domain-containing protein [Pirellulaceae bacterium]HMO93205.1 DPP IV N-terminal domain-containing protein [Pirellulaceae bacterium]HMP70036.1 DPP IV N-terminal domain-containing protein [Pirellulaceae bacterium]